MAMQPPPLMSCPETISCFSEKIMASITLKGSINQFEVKLFLERFSFILSYVIIKFGYNARCHWLKEHAL